MLVHAENLERVVRGTILEARVAPAGTLSRPGGFNPAWHSELCLGHSLSRPVRDESTSVGESADGTGRRTAPAESQGSLLIAVGKSAGVGFFAIHPTIEVPLTR